MCQKHFRRQTNVWHGNYMEMNIKNEYKIQKLDIANKKKYKIVQNHSMLK